MSDNSTVRKRNTSHLTIRKRSPLSSYSDSAYRILSQWLDVDTSLLYEVLEALKAGEAYYTYKIPKHGTYEWREINDPYGGLKEIQRRILDRLLYTVPVSNAAHGAVQARSVVTNALEHLPDAKEVLSLDIRNAFPSVRFSRVHRIFRKYIKPILRKHGPLPSPNTGGNPPLDEAIHLLAALTTYPRSIKQKGQTQKVWCLPQGAPTSGYLLNLACRALDRKIFKIFDKHPNLNLRYSRYLDDMTISSSVELPADVQRELELAVKKNDFRLNRDKTKKYGPTDTPVICGVMLRQGHVEAEPELIQRCNDLLKRSVHVDDPRVELQNRRKIRGILSFFKMVYGDQMPTEISEPYSEYRSARNLPPEPSIPAPAHPTVSARAVEHQSAMSLLAQWLDISMDTLNTAHQKSLSEDGYEHWSIDKKNGSKRQIYSPCLEVKDIQDKLLSRLLYHIPVSVAAHGFVPGRSIVTNALAHANARYLLNLDLKDAFPSVSRKRVEHCLNVGLGGLLKRFGLRCPTALRQDVIGLIADFVTYKDALPQGAPTSGYLLNLACHTQDKRIFELLERTAPNVTYTRYADDLTFTSTEPLPEGFLEAIQNEINRSGFRWHPQKTHFAAVHKGQNMEICGLRLDGSTLRIPRKKLKHYRSVLRRATNKLETGGLDTETRHKIQGIVGFVQMVYGELPRSLSQPYAAFLQKHPEARPTGSAHEKISFYPNIQT